MSNKVTFRINEAEEKSLDELELNLRNLNFDVKSRTDTIKEAIRISLWFINNSPFSHIARKTEEKKPEIAQSQPRYITKISSDQINIDGSRKS